MVCLDTSFIVDFLRGNHDAKRVLDELVASAETTTIAAPTIMELRASIALNERNTHEQHLLYKIKASSVILHLDDASATRAGDTEAALILAGDVIPPVDIMIGAIALENNETVLTRNVKHFRRIPDLKLKTY